MHIHKNASWNLVSLSAVLYQRENKKSPNDESLSFFFPGKKYVTYFIFLKIYIKG